MIDFYYKEHKTLRDRVYFELKMRIMKGIMEPGSRIMELELAEELEVSRTPIREAMRKLEQEGFIVIEPQKGAHVSEVSLKDMIDVLIVRESLEGLATYIATLEAGPEEIKELYSITDRYAVAIEKNCTDDIIYYDEQFHDRILQFTKNKIMIQSGELVQDSSLRFRYLYYDYLGENTAMPEQHVNIVEAMGEGDAARARYAAEKHVSDLRRVLIVEGNRLQEKRRREEKLRKNR